MMTPQRRPRTPRARRARGTPAAARASRSCSAAAAPAAPRCCSRCAIGIGRDAVPVHRRRARRETPERFLQAVPRRVAVRVNGPAPRRRSRRRRRAPRSIARWRWLDTRARAAATRRRRSCSTSSSSCARSRASPACARAARAAARAGGERQPLRADQRYVARAHRLLRDAAARFEVIHLPPLTPAKSRAMLPPTGRRYRADADDDDARRSRPRLVQALADGRAAYVRALGDAAGSDGAARRPIRSAR